MNEYAATLALKLTQHGHKPYCVICTLPAGMRRWLDLARKFAHRTGIRRRLHQRRSPRTDPVSYLREYARSHGLKGWDLFLDDICQQEGIGFLAPASINGDTVATYLKAEKLDILINAGGGIFESLLIEAPRIGVLNAHMGFLPSFRGVHVLEWSLFHDHPIGVTVHFIDRGIDTGDILSFREIAIDEDDTVETLRAKSLPLNVELVVEAVRLLGHGQVQRKRQKVCEGRQYFAMHPRLKALVDRRLEQLHRQRDGS